MSIQNKIANNAILLIVAAGVLLCLMVFLSSGAALAAKTAKKTAPSSDPIRKEFASAEAYHKNLLTNKNIAASRDNWLTGIMLFRNAFAQSPKHELAPDCLFQAGIMYGELYQLHGVSRDLDDAIAKFEDVANFYPAHPLAGESLLQAGSLQYSGKQDRQKATRTLTKLIALYGKDELGKKATAELDKIKKATAKPATTAASGHSEKNTSTSAKASGDKPARIIDVRHGSTKYYTRITIETSSPVNYAEHLLPSQDGRPPRFYIDIANSKISKKQTEPIRVDDGLLTQVRSAQFSPDAVRVVLDTQSLADYQITTQENPYRIMVDIWGKGKGGKEAMARLPKERPEKESPAKPSLPQQLGLRAKRIVVDPGHGGKDPGAIGIDGLQEKDIVLKLGLYTAERLREKGFEVIMTRSRDVFLSLEERTEIANTSSADLFISIHINSAPNPNAQGIETYYLSLAASPDEMRAAATENKSSARKLSDLQAILQDLMQNSKVNESAKLAASVQDNLVKGLGRKYPDVNSLGVKKAPFIVLIGAQMPAVLAEVSFLSNPNEAHRLTSDTYLQEAADNLTAGIARYAGELNVAYRSH